MQTLLQDLRYGIRTLAKTPGVAILIIVTLSLGIASSTLLFNMVRQWVLNAAPFPQPDQLTVLWEIDTKKGWENSSSAPDFNDWREQNTAFENLSAIMVATTQVRVSANCSALASMMMPRRIAFLLMRSRTGR